MPKGVLGVEKAKELTNTLYIVSYCLHSIRNTNIIITIYQQTALKTSNTDESVSMSVDSGSMVFDSTADPNKEILVDHFRFTKAEDILFALEVDGEFVYNLLCRKIYKKPNAKANEILHCWKLLPQ